jgi:hypothetical protein
MFSRGYWIKHNRKCNLLLRRGIYYGYIELEIEHSLFGETDLYELSFILDAEIDYSWVRYNKLDDTYFWYIGFKSGNNFFVSKEDLFELANKIEELT